MIYIFTGQIQKIPLLKLNISYTNLTRAKYADWDKSRNWLESKQVHWRSGVDYIEILI